MKSLIAPPTDPNLLRVLEGLRAAGAKAWIVGGWVRDALLGRDVKDIDVEVFGLDAAQLCSVLQNYGEVHRVGQAFPIIRVKGLDVDFSLPRADSLGGTSRGDLVHGVDPFLDPKVAAQRRDLTINAMAYDPLSETLFDPLDGRRDLQAKRLRAANAARFGDDPIRALRVAELMARLEFEPDEELISLCRAQDLSDTAAERRYEAFRKLLLRGLRPSCGLSFLKKCELLQFFLELQNLLSPDDDNQHWQHTLRTVDTMSELLREATDFAAGDRSALMFAALCCRFSAASGGNMRSSERFLNQMAAPHRLSTQVTSLVAEQDALQQNVALVEVDAAYRQLARRLQAGEVCLRLLERLLRAQWLAQNNHSSSSIAFPEGDEILARAERLGIVERALEPLVLGRHVLARGIEPGPRIGLVLKRCIELQDRTGWQEPDRILDAALSQL